MTAYTIADDRSYFNCGEKGHLSYNCPQPKNYNSYDGGRGGRGRGRSAAEAMVALMVAVEAVEAMMVAVEVVAAMILAVEVVVEVVVEAEVGVALGLMQP